MPPQQPQQGGDNSLDFLWIVVLLIVTVWAIFYFFHDQIVGMVLYVKYHEIALLRHLIPSLVPVQQQIAETSPLNYGSISMPSLYNISALVGNYFRYPAAIILGLYAILIYANSVRLKFRATYSMQSLVAHEKQDWPQINPVARLDLVDIPIDEGPWSMAQTPMQFAKKHHLLQEMYNLPGEDELSTQMKVTVMLQKGEAYRIFVMQLGHYWTGVEALPPYARALFAIFAARIAGDREGAAHLTTELARSALTGTINFAGADKLLVKHVNHKLVAKVIEHHAFEITVMASMLAAARNDGVLASADFLWLKVVDRKLWYMLNSVGRQTPFIEIAGPYAHWISELKFGRRLKLPMVDEAVIGLEQAIQEVIYTPDGPD